MFPVPHPPPHPVCRRNRLSSVADGDVASECASRLALESPDASHHGAAGFIRDRQQMRQLHPTPHALCRQLQLPLSDILSVRRCDQLVAIASVAMEEGVVKPAALVALVGAPHATAATVPVSGSQRTLEPTRHSRS